FTNDDFIIIKNELFSTIPNGTQIGLFENINDSNQISLPYYNTTAFTHTIYAKITNLNCYDPIPITLIVDTFEEDIQDEFFSTCSGESVTLQAEEGYD